MIRAFLIATLLASIFTAVPPAAKVLAQPSAADEEEARATFQAARLAYENGRYTDAYAMFERSYNLSGRHILLFNMGQAADRARMDDEALDALERYLANDAEVDETLRPEIELRLTALRAAQQREVEAREAREASERAAAARAAETDGQIVVPTPQETARANQTNPLVTAPTPEEDTDGGNTKWIVIGVVAAVLIAGGVTTALLLRDPGVQAPLPPNTGIVVEALR